MDTINGELGPRDRERLGEPLRENDLEFGETDPEFRERLRDIENSADAAVSSARRTIDDIRRMEADGAELTEEEAARLAKSTADIEDKNQGFWAKVRGLFKRETTDSATAAGLGLTKEGSAEMTPAGEENEEERMFFDEGEKEENKLAEDFSDLEERKPAPNASEETTTNERAKIALTGPADFKKQAQQIWHEIIEAPIEDRQETLKEKQEAGFSLSRAEKKELKFRVGTTPMSKEEKTAYQELLKAGSKENLKEKYRRVIEAAEAKENYTADEYEQMKAGEIPWKASALWQAVRENDMGRLDFPPIAKQGKEWSGAQPVGRHAANIAEHNASLAETAALAGAALAGGAAIAHGAKGEEPDWSTYENADTGRSPAEEEVGSESLPDDERSSEESGELASPEEIMTEVDARFKEKQRWALENLDSVPVQEVKDMLAAISRVTKPKSIRKKLVEAEYLTAEEAQSLSDEQIITLKEQRANDLQYLIDLKEGRLELGERKTGPVEPTPTPEDLARAEAAEYRRTQAKDNIEEQIAVQEAENHDYITARVRKKDYATGEIKESWEKMISDAEKASTLDELAESLAGDEITKEEILGSGLDRQELKAYLDTIVSKLREQIALSERLETEKAADEEKARKKAEAAAANEARKQEKEPISKALAGKLLKVGLTESELAGVQIDLNQFRDINAALKAGEDDKRSLSNKRKDAAKSKAARDKINVATAESIRAIIAK